MIERAAARVILLDAEGRTLLFRGIDPWRPEIAWWMTPGGGIEDGESVQDAARREVLEETGLVLAGPLGDVVLHRDIEFPFEGELYRQHEDLFVAVIDPAAVLVDRSGWTAIERRSMTEHRWWNLAELRTTSELVYPEGLADLIDAWRDGFAAPDGGDGRD